MPEEVVYSYYDTAGNYIWYGSLTGVHVVRNNRSYDYPVIVVYEQS